MTAAEIIKTLTEEFGLSQAKIGEVIGCKQSAVSKYKNRKRIPPLEVGIKLIQLAKRYKIKVKIEELIN